MFGLLSKNKEGIFNVGLLEMAIALYPIIAGYGYGSFKLAFGFLLIIDVCLIGRMRQSNVSFRQLYQYLVLLYCTIQCGCFCYSRYLIIL